MDSTGWWDRGKRSAEYLAASEQADVRSHATPAQLVAQLFPPPRLSALDRADRPSQIPGRLLLALSLEIAKDQGVRKRSGNLSISWWSKAPISSPFTAGFSSRGAAARASCRRRRADSRVHAPPSEKRPDAATARASREPTSRGPSARTPEMWPETHLRCHERRPVSSGTQNHRSMPLDQHGKCQLGSLAAIGRKPLQKLAVGELPNRTDVEKRFEAL